MFLKKLLRQTLARLNNIKTSTSTGWTGSLNMNLSRRVHGDQAMATIPKGSNPKQIKKTITEAILKAMTSTIRILKYLPLWLLWTEESLRKDYLPPLNSVRRLYPEATISHSWTKVLKARRTAIASLQPTPPVLFRMQSSTDSWTSSGRRTTPWNKSRGSSCSQLTLLK